MALDLAADPWGTAMIVSAAVIALAAFILLAALLTGTPKWSAAKILGAGCFLFLATAAGGTWQRIATTDTEVKVEAKPAPAPVTIVATEPPPDPDAGDVPPPADGGEAGTPGTAAAARLAPTKPLTIDTSKAELAAPPPLPEQADARPQAIATRIRLAKSIAGEDARCTDAKTVAEAWLTLKELPPAAPGLKGAVSRLEGCRRRIRSTKQYWVRRTRVNARNAYAEELPAKLKHDDSVVFVNVRGPAHERIRIGGKSITPQRVETLLADGLATHLKALGFSEVTFASGKSSATENYDVPTDADIVDEVMGRWGLADKLAVP